VSHITLIEQGASPPEKEDHARRPAGAVVVGYNRTERRSL
jgi:hypothetical protein